MLDNNYLDNEQMIFDEMTEAVIIFDKNRQIQYFNDSARDIFGISHSEIEGLEQIPSLKENKKFSRFIKETFSKKDKAQNTELIYDNGTIETVLKLRTNRIVKNGKDKGMILLGADVTADSDLRRFEKDSASTFIGIVLSICIYLFIWSLLEFTLHIHYRPSEYTKVIEAISFVLFLEVLFLSSLSLKDVGVFVSPKQLVKSLGQVLPIIGIAGVILIAINAGLHLSGHALKEPFFGGSWAKAVTYISVAILQEFLARGVLQTSIRFLVKVKWQKFFNVLLSSLLFTLMHLPHGFPFMMGALVMGIGLGIIYEYQKNIWGCALIHWVCGYLAISMFF
ncbi:MAG: CPBP family intramembrane metalloprotease [Eubacterium sp.]|nr:CPBP family intramembrane metalloprotease [Eubacterium sp.]